MLRPERMSKVSITGSKAVMDEVVDAVHGLNLVHLSEYDGSWEGFDPGSSMSGADEVSERLVTVRSLESILGVEPGDAGRVQRVSDEVEAELEEVRREVNELDDRRDEIESELREVEERLETVAPFAVLDIDLDLLSGYDNLAVAVGEGDPEAVEAALAAEDDVRAFELFTGDGVVAAFAYPKDDAPAGVLEDALVGVDFASLEVPDAEGPPGAYIEELDGRKHKLESRLETVENELEDLKLDAASFLLAVEEELTVEAQKREAPLSFATTRRSFVAEGWVPSDRYADVEAAVEGAVGDRAEVEELRRISHEEYAREHVGEDHGEHAEEETEEHPAREDEEVPAEPPTAATDGGASATNDGETEAKTDGGTAAAAGGVAAGAVTMDDEPPVVLENPAPARPFELLVEAVERPLYAEFDPTIILWLTFPVFFGFMIGDVGYGILYVSIGYVLWSRFDSDAVRALGGIAIWAGVFTTIFGVLFGEILGLHLITEYFWHGVFGMEHAPIEKGLSPAAVDYARMWLIAVSLVGLGHMTFGFVLDFFKNLPSGFDRAALASGSWAALFVGVWVWILSRHAEAAKPEFLFTAFDGHPIPLGFAGFPETVGFAGLGLTALGLLGIFYEEASHYGVVAGVIIAVLEGLLGSLVNVLSYTRIAAVLLAKAGMAFVVNLLFFGAYSEPTGHGEEFHFMLTEGPHAVLEHHEAATIMFPGLVHMGLAGVLVGVLVFVIGHLLVLGLGVTSAGLQGVRLEYVEFFQKFYEGGGDPYRPFGHERSYTAEE